MLLGHMQIAKTLDYPAYLCSQFNALTGHLQNIKGITAFKFVIWGGKSVVLRSEILFYGDTSAKP